MKAIGIVLLIFGLLALAGGLIGTACVQLMEHRSCEKAAQDVQRLNREADAPSGSSDSSRFSEDAEVSASICSDDEFIAMIVTVVGIIAAVLGLITAIAGFFVFRRDRAAVQ